MRAVESEKFAEVAKVKEALIAEAEALAESTDWAATADKLKALQAQWKDSGHLPRKQGDELWKRFRAACDTSSSAASRCSTRATPKKPTTSREAGADRARERRRRGAPGDGGWGKAIGEIKDLQREWKEIGFVPRRDADAVYKRVPRARATRCSRSATKRATPRPTRIAPSSTRCKAEIEAVIAGGDDVVARAIAVRAKARELDAASWRPRSRRWCAT